MRESEVMRTFERPVYIWFAPSHPEQPLRREPFSRAYKHNVEGTYDDDEEIDDLAWVSLDIQDERIRNARRRAKDNDNLTSFQPRSR